MEKQISNGNGDLPAIHFNTNTAFRNNDRLPEFDPEEFGQQIRQAGIDPAGRFVASVCIGIRPNYKNDCQKENYRTFTEKLLNVYNDIQTRFSQDKCGFEVFSNEELICMACFFDSSESEAFAEEHIRPLLADLENRYELLLFAALGIFVDSPERFEEAYTSAFRAFQTYYFNPTQIIVMNKGSRQRRYAAIDEYFRELESAFRSILIHDPESAGKLTAVVDILYDFHYGNKQAMIMHTMEYTGTIAMRLKQYRLLETDFFELQNNLQHRACNSATYSELRELIYRHFHDLLPQIYVNDRPKAKLVIEQVKEYTKEHFMENLTVEKMAEFAHFSSDYFIHLFKNETGKTYKNFLTEIRMKHAIELLRDTEYRVSEICEKVGYNNPRAFGEAFKQMYSMSPMDYRRKYRKK